MTNHDQQINSHYGRENLAEEILASLRGAGKDLDALRMDDLAGIEEFHIGGRAATLRLGEFAEVRPGLRVLDVGCGIGGPARVLAERFGCRVTGVDLTEEFCKTGNLLSELVGLSDRVALHHGSALELPFDDGQFDLVWTQHVTMNIEDMQGFLSEIARVLSSDGRYAFYEILAGAEPVAHYPVPWSSDGAISFLEAQ